MPSLCETKYAWTLTCFVSGIRHENEIWECRYCKAINPLFIRQIYVLPTLVRLMILGYQYSRIPSSAYSQAILNTASRTTSTRLASRTCCRIPSYIQKTCNLFPLYWIPSTIQRASSPVSPYWFPSIVRKAYSPALTLRITFTVRSTTFPNSTWKPPVYKLSFSSTESYWSRTSEEY